MKTLFHVIKYQTDNKIIGTYEQIKGFNVSPNQVGAQKFGYLSEIEQAEDLPNLHHFLLDTKAKFTDALTNNIIGVIAGLFISERAKKLFESFNIQANYHSASVHSVSKKVMPCYYMEIKCIPDAINYKESIFVIKDDLLDEVHGHIQVTNYLDFVEKTKKISLDIRTEGSSILPDKLVMNQKLDIFRYPMEANILCSQNLQDAIISEGLTGFAFGKASWEIEHP